jgi:hypothetical protein
MNSNSSRLLTVVLCLACAALGYFLGQSKDAPAAKSNAASSAVAPATTTETKATADTPTLATLDRDKGERPNVRQLVVQARAAMGSGMGMFMNMRGMIRAIAPLAELNPEEIQQALAEIEATVKEPQQKMMFYSMLLAQWAETDGPAAMAYAKEKIQGQGPMMGGIQMQVVGTWARKDPEAAWKWWQGVRDSGERTQFGGPEGYLAGIFGGLAQSSVDTAFSRLATLQDHEKQSALQGIAMTAMDSRNRDALLARASSLEPDLRGNLYRSIVGTWMMTDADGATKWIDSLPGDERKGVAQQAGQMLLWQDPARGAEMMLKNADEQSLPQTYSQIASQWANRDPQAAGEWLNKQPAGPPLDQARSSFAFTIAERDPAGAFEWAKAITDDNSRESAYTSIYSRLLQKGPERANAALEAAGLPADLAAKIRENTKPAPGGAGLLLAPPAPTRAR